MQIARLKLSTLIVSVLTTILLAVCLFVFLNMQANKTVAINGEQYNKIIDQKDLVADVLPPPEYLIETWQLILQSVAMNASSAGPLQQKVSVLRAEFEKRHAYWEKKLNNPEIKHLMAEQLYASGQAFFAIYDHKFIPALNAQDKKQIESALHELNAAYEAHRTIVDQVVIYTNKTAQTLEAETAQVISKGEIANYVMVLLLIAFASGLGYFIVSTVKKRLGMDPVELSELAGRFSDGDFSAHIALPVGDETSVAHSMQVLQRTLSKLSTETNRLAKAAIEGQLSRRAETAAFNGEFKRLVEGFNQTLDGVIVPLNVAASYVADISKGNIPDKITATYHGDFNAIKDNLNHCIDAVNALITDANMLSEAAVAGRLSTRADASKHEGDFRKIVEGVNHTLDAVISPLNVAAEYVDHIAKGRIPAKITDTYRGDFNTIKNNLNQCIEAVNALIADTNMLSQAAVRGELSTRAEARQHEGDFRKIVEGVNATLDAVIVPLNMAASYVARISRGEIPALITETYHGDFNEIKRNLNTCIQAVNHLVEDSALLAQAAKEGRIQVRADETKHTGDFRKVIAGVNQTLDLIVEPIKAVRQAVEAIDIAASEIAAGNNQLSRRTEDQAANLEETAASMEQLASIVKHNTENAQQANELALAASSVAENGGEVVRQVIESMNAMNESAQQIEDIIAVIDGISFQTNILALNAAVEAARAGEQGRGFAVVANEVGALAHRSSIAAKEIKELITTSVSNTYEGVKQVGNAGKTMEEVVSSVKKVSAIMTEISDASFEQSKGIQQVNQAITTIDEATQQNAALVEEAAAAAESLLDQAHHLSQSVQRFKLDQATTQQTHWQLTAPLVEAA
ncbi:methyl-accepting chemotaxis protein [Methylophilus sp. 13]|uniref:methyl-accepting chemotaxis protein n=1 Tax=Methylophilus sp. 13 TaxID=2781018 RepID=UPI00272EC9F6|nr:methyl-accepting chemotaxis protein [Methylophilus sp. 13]